jgi:hypothetical protein
MKLPPVNEVATCRASCDLVRYVVFMVGSPGYWPSFAPYSQPVAAQSPLSDGTWLAHAIGITIVIVLCGVAAVGFRCC